MLSLKMIRFSVALLILIIMFVTLPMTFSMGVTVFQQQTSDATPSPCRVEPKPLPLLPEIGAPQRDKLSPITVENASRLASLSKWDLIREEEDPDWQLGPLFFDPNSGLLARLKTGHIFFQMGIWHLWDVSDPFAPNDLDTVPGTEYDYTFWTYSDTVFTDAGYAQAHMSAEFTGFQDWGGSAMPSTRWITYQRSGGPDIIVQQDYVGQQYSPEVWLKLSPDGSHLMVYSPGRLYVWDAEQERVLASISPGAAPYLVGFSPDNHYIVTVEEEAFVIRRIEPGELVQVVSLPGAWGQAEALPTPQFMPDNNARFVKASGRELEVWDLDSQTLVNSAIVPCVTIQQIALNPDGTLLALSADCSTTAGRHPSEIQIWDVHTMNEVTAFPASTAVTDLVFSPDGYLLAIGDAAQTELWGIPTE